MLNGLKWNDKYIYLTKPKTRMHCNTCKEPVKTDDITEHIQHHIHDKQYGIRALDLSAMLANLTARVENLEGLVAALGAKNKAEIRKCA